MILCVYLIFLKCVWHLGGCVALNHTQTLKSTRLGFSLVSCNWIIIESPQVAQITLCRQSVSHHPGRALFIIFCTPFSAREVCRYTSVYHNVFLAERTSTEGIIYRNDLDSNSSSNRDCLGQLSRLRYPRFEVYYISWKPGDAGRGHCSSGVNSLRLPSWDFHVAPQISRFFPAASGPEGPVTASYLVLTTSSPIFGAPVNESRKLITVSLGFRDIDT